jgi:hypothetical protein
VEGGEMNLLRLEFIIDTFLKKKFGYDFEKPVIVDFERIENECREEQAIIDGRESVKIKLYKMQKQSPHKIVFDDSSATFRKLTKKQSTIRRKKYELAKQKSI